MRGCGETCQCDNNYRNCTSCNRPRAPKHPYAQLWGHGKSKKKKTATVSRPSHRQWILGCFNMTTAENQITVVMTAHPCNSDNVKLSHTGLTLRHKINTKYADWQHRKGYISSWVTGWTRCVWICVWRIKKKKEGASQFAYLWVILRIRSHRMSFSISLCNLPMPVKFCKKNHKLLSNHWQE